MAYVTVAKETYVLSKIQINVDFTNSLLSQPLFERTFLFNKSSLHSDLTVLTLTISEGETIQIPPTAECICNTLCFRVLKKSPFYYLQGQHSVFSLDLAKNHGAGYISTEFWNLPLKLQQDFFILAILWLIHRHGFYAIHGNALVKGGIGIIIAGISGSGKSSLTLGLILRGWQFLSDDITILNKLGVGGIEALAFIRGISLAPDFAKRYSELYGSMQKAICNDKKWLIDMQEIYEDRFITTCVPHFLVFPKIMAHPQSRLTAISKAQTLVRLIETSGGMLVNREMAVRQQEMLKQFVNQSRGYLLLAGQDLYQEPGKLDEILCVEGII